MKTVKQHLEEALPKDILERAIKNTPESHLAAKTTTLQALAQAFNWGISPEGAKYWQAVYKKYFEMQDDTLIPEPNNEEKKVISDVSKDELYKELETLLHKFKTNDIPFIVTYHDKEKKQLELITYCNKNFSINAVSAILNNI